ncbi:uncharacterized protein LOC125335985 [Corvus hawaiiensis]|uniref:uncharacterized protein LOC125335985 n=1 Tax=Corvus hawaiiensis TaxID=134902 RepID=UPI0020186574|nr:uncharacterized protein LOC125335985 [Corvus hawaiiensis]
MKGGMCLGVCAPGAAWGGNAPALPSGAARSGLTMSLPAKRCGRPPMLSFLEKKKRKQSLDRRRGKTRIYMGNHIDRWLTLKEKLDFRNDAEVAGFLLDMYDSYNPLSKATLCPLSEGVRRITVKEARVLSASTSLITADGTYDSGDQLLKESACSGFGDVRIVTVKEEEEMLPDCMLTRTADIRVSSKKKVTLLHNNMGPVFSPI